MSRPAEDRRIKVHDLLASKSSWNQYSTALNAEGLGTLSQYRDAVSWCLMGAIIKCYAGPEAAHNPELERVCRKITNKIGQGIMGWNDAEGRTHDEVLALCVELDV